jgi:uncharacterized membrane protein
MPDPGLRQLFTRFHRNDSGAVSIIFALFLLLGIGLSVLVIDTGHLYLAKRRVQAAVDAAALAAVGNVQNADQIAANVLANNGYTSDATVQTGGYSADSSLAVSARFDSSSSQPNAVRVTKTITTPTILAGAIGANTLSSIKVTATAARVPAVSFAAGSGLASLSGGELNAVLGGLLGTTLSLSLVNYQALAATNVDALTFLNQLAAQANVTAGTYGDLANTNVTLGQVIAAAQAALTIHPNGNDSAALDALNVLSLQTSPALSSSVGQLVNTALWQNRDIGSIVQQTPGNTMVNLFDLVSTAARIYGAGHVVTTGSAVSLPIAGTAVSTHLSVGSPMTPIAVGGVGTTVSTSQVRLAMTVTAANINLGVASANISLPVYLQIASGQARVAAIPCGAGNVMTTISTASQAVSAQLGVVSDAALSNFGGNPVVQPAAIVSLSVLGIPVVINGSGSLTLAGGAETGENFSQADIDAGTVHTAYGSDAGHVFSSLAGNMVLTAAFSGGALTGAVNTLVNGTVVPLLKTTLVTLLTALDPVTDTLLTTLGLRLAAIDVLVHGVSCGVPTLVG